MIFEVKLLGTNIEVTEGCLVIGPNGESGDYDPYSDFYTQKPSGYWKAAFLFIVRYEYNQMVIVGRFSSEAKWLKNGDKVRSVDIVLWFYDEKLKDFMYPVPVPENKMEQYNTEFVYNIAARHRQLAGCENYVALWRIECPSCKQLH